VIFDLGAANHDPAAIIDPDRFDTGRDNRRQIAFGHGQRYCIGAPLARIECRSSSLHSPADSPTCVWPPIPAS
jgi:cytochrome P450